VEWSHKIFSQTIRLNLYLFTLFWMFLQNTSKSQQQNAWLLHTVWYNFIWKIEWCIEWNIRGFKTNTSTWI